MEQKGCRAPLYLQYSGFDSGLPRLEPTQVRYERHRYAHMGRYPNFRGQFGEAKGLFQHVTTVKAPVCYTQGSVRRWLNPEGPLGDSR